MHFIDILAQTIPLGGYIAIWKIIIFVMLFGIWAWVGQWVDKDTQVVNTRQDFWNSLYLGCGMLILVLWFILPAPFVVELLLFLVIWCMIVVVYILHRNSKVPRNQTILTKDHIKWLMSSDKKTDPSKLRLVFISVNDNDLPVPSPEDEEYGGYVMGETLLHDMWKRRVSHAELIPSSDEYKVRYVIDGIASVVDQYSREDAVGCIQYLKAVAGLDVLDRRRPQTGSFFTIRTRKDNIGWRILTSGSTRGEQLTLERIEEDKEMAIDSLGFHPDQLEQINEVIDTPKGVILVSGIRGSGVTTTLYSLTRSHDAFIQNIHSLELEFLTELDNITQHLIERDAQAKTHNRQLQSVLHSDPDVVMVGFCDEPDLAKTVTKACEEGKKFFIGMTAVNTFAALSEWIKMAGKNDKVAQAIVAVINQKLVRILCHECREAYVPNPGMLKKLNLPVEKIKQFYRPPAEMEYDKRGNPILCPQCQGTGYMRRTAVFETLIVSDALRHLIAQGADMDAIRTQCRKEKMLYLQEQVLRKVIDGTTSIQEVLRLTSSKKKKRPASK